jgi:4-hydroxy-3-methylbut-2-en-1-yl diphosphate synthase IspG/GcpE
MTTTKTADVDGTLAQIYALAAAGCDIVRCTCNEEEAAEGLAQIVPRSPVPIIADIHFQYRLAPPSAHRSCAPRTGSVRDSTSRHRNRRRSNAH